MDAIVIVFIVFSAAFFLEIFIKNADYKIKGFMICLFFISTIYLVSDNNNKTEIRILKLLLDNEIELNMEHRSSFNNNSESNYKFASLSKDSLNYENDGDNLVLMPFMNSKVMVKKFYNTGTFALLLCLIEQNGIKFLYNSQKYDILKMDEFVLKQIEYIYNASIKKNKIKKE